MMVRARLPVAAAFAALALALAACSRADLTVSPDVVSRISAMVWANG